MQCTQVYSLPIVYQDLKQQFVLQDVFQQLKQLDVIVSDVFGRLKQKLEGEKSRLCSINERISLCQSKVNAITDRGSSNKPTTVFSTSKYPAIDVMSGTKCLYSDKSFAENPPLDPEPDEDVHYLPAEANNPSQRGQASTDLLELFAKTNSHKEIVKAEVTMTEEGLGRLPDTIRCIGSVLLFNSGENPYQKYTSWDNLLGTEYEVDEEKQKELAKAPKTLVEGDELPSVSGLNYDFHPSMGQHADLSKQLPVNLPLENIADYNYAADSTAIASIAPSMFQDGSLPDLPQIADFAYGPKVHEPTSSLQAPIGPVDLPPPPPELQQDPFLPPPPPPPLPNEVQDVPVQFSSPSPPPPLSLPETVEFPPSPPQPMIPSLPVQNDLPIVAENPRSSLMDAIRNAGNLKRLKKVEDIPMESKLEMAQSNTSKPLSIAEEMRLKLGRRQAAISGKQDQLEQKRDRELAKPTRVLKGQEISRSKTSSALPVVDISDDEAESLKSDKQSSYGDEGDMLAQLKRIEKNHNQNRGIESKSTSNTNSGLSSDIEKVIPGITAKLDRDSSLDLSEASDWSDD